MAVRKILTISKHEKFLTTKSEPVHKINREIKALFQDLRDTIEENPAVGLAAPQIGVSKRVFAVLLGYYDEPETDDESEAELPPIEPTIMVNPEIVEREGVERGFDACLSIPGMMGYTDRDLEIRVKYMDEQGNKQDRTFAGWDARMIQHELDHLYGILFTKRLESLDDLYVIAKDADGNRIEIPYPEFVRKTTQQVIGKPLSTTP